MEHVACNLCGADDYELVYPSTLPGGASRETPGGGGEAGLKLSNPGPQSYTCTNLGYGLHPPIVRCRRCGLAYTNPRRAAEAVHTSYAEVVDELYLAERDGRVITFQRYLEPIEAMLGPGDGQRLLDVGCHVGVFVEIAAARGWDAWGVEPSRWAAGQARVRGLQVVTGTLSDAGFEAGSFNVVTLWDVIEHLTDPAGELRQVWQVLRPGGMIVVHTMDIESLLARLMGARWPWLMEMHLYYFSPATLSALLQRVGFQVISQHRQGRYLRLGYLASRLTPYSPAVAQALGSLFDRLRLAGQPVPINLGDLFTVYGRKGMTR